MLMHLLNVMKKLLISGLINFAENSNDSYHDAPCANQGGWEQKILGMDYISFEAMLNCVKGINETRFFPQH